MLVTNCLECGKAFKRMSLKSRTKYCHECRTPTKNRYQQKESKQKRQAKDALATLDEHNSRLDAIELTQEAKLGEINAVANDVAAKAAILVAEEVDRVLAERGLEGENLKQVMTNIAKINTRLLRLEAKMNNLNTEPKIGVRKNTIRDMKKEMSRLRGMIETLPPHRGVEEPKLKQTRAQINRRGRIGKVIRHLHKVEVTGLSGIMSVPLKGVSQVTVYNNLKWAEKKGYVKKHKMGQKTAYTIGENHWSDHYKRKAEKGKAKEEE